MSANESLDPLNCVADVEAALADPRLDHPESESFRAASYNLALALGQCRAFGIALPAEIDGCIEPSMALAASEWMTAEAEHLTENCEGLSPLLDEDPIECEEMNLGALEARMDLWLADIALDEALETALDDEPEQARRLADALNELGAQLIHLDDAMFSQRDLLAVATDTNLLENWRALTERAPEYGTPWWLDGTLEQAATENRRMAEANLQELNAAFQRTRQSRRSLAEPSSGPAPLRRQPANWKDRNFAFSIAAAGPAAPPNPEYFVWKSPEDSDLRARLDVQPGPPPAIIAVEFYHASDDSDVTELAGEACRLDGVESMIKGCVARFDFQLVLVADSGEIPALSVGSPAQKWELVESRTNEASA